MLVNGPQRRLGIAAHCINFAPVTDDTCILRERLQLRIRHGGYFCDFKLVKGLLVARPLS